MLLRGSSKVCITRAPKVRAQELCQSGGGRPGLSVPNCPYGICGRKATLNLNVSRAQELCEGRGGRLGLSVGVKQA